MRLALLAFAALAFGCGAPPPDASRPNFVLVLTDDQGYGDLGAHGNDRIRTPNLDRMAAQGVEFERFYVEPVCSPTRAALMTGRYHYRTGVLHTSRGGAKMHGDETTIAEMLREAGYRTGHFGKWHLGDNDPMRPMDQGFEESVWHKSGGIDQSPDRPNSYFDPWLWRNDEKFQAKGYCADIFFDAALDFITRRAKEPFFVYLATNTPHDPLQVAEQYWQPYVEAGVPEATAKVYGMVENIDHNMGRLFDKLDALGLRDNTVVVFLTDNGPQHDRYRAGLRGIKAAVYEGGVRAISLWQGPGFGSPRKIKPFAAHVDVTPTFAELAGLPAVAMAELDGRSLVPLLLDDQSGRPERTHFTQVHRGLEVRPGQNAAVITDRYKLVLGPGTFNREDPPFSSEPPVELYDLESDPGELNNLAGREPEIVADLRARYDAWFDSVSGSRAFTPGVIRLGAEREDPAVLCRYQDSTYVGGRPTSWSVHIDDPGGYELTVRLSDEEKGRPGKIIVEINGARQEQSVAADNPSAVFELPAGPAALAVWFEPAGRPHVQHLANDTVGDVTVRRSR
jgi:arylsulfatase A-like enzyme